MSRLVRRLICRLTHHRPEHISRGALSCSRCGRRWLGPVSS